MDLTTLKGISYKRKKLLEKLNIFSIGDLLAFLPRKYKNLSEFSQLSDAVFNEKEEILVSATVIQIEKVFTRNRKRFLKIKIQDESATAHLIAFNQPFLAKNLEVGKSYSIIGSFSYQYGEIQASSFQIENSNEKSLHYGRIVPFYPLTEGITQKWLREMIFQALELVKPRLNENLPDFLVQNKKFPSRLDALWNIHFPESQELLDAARYRVKYFELFKLEFQMALKRFLFQKTKNRSYESLELMENFLKSIPFQLTPGQKSSVEDIKNDMLSSTPMHRLLQGDVGAGKTLVSILSLLIAIGNGYQGVLMVPTEVLARQHYQKIREMLKPLGINVGLLMSAVKGRARVQVASRVQSGDIQLLIGTHAVFGEEIQYKNLAIAIIDEQHKFGVEQRAALIAKGENPDILIMTATPIPRTLGITVFGDMDISIIPDKPAGRKPIQTLWKSENDSDKVFCFIDEEIEKGHQGYIVYPLIEDSEKLDLKSVMTMFETLQNGVLSHRKLVLLHGRMNEEEKEEAMAKFIGKEADILVSTTVIEVGVDVPDATFMVIENAHRFGLSTLHQLRGRVGRNNLQSFCILMTPKNISEDGKSRMMAMRDTSDGFVLSQKDLELRGVGDFLGTRQKGSLGLKLASVIHDTEILNEARDDAFAIVQNDRHLENPAHRVFKPWYTAFCKKYHSLLRT